MTDPIKDDSLTALKDSVSAGFQDETKCRKFTYGQARALIARLESAETALKPFSLEARRLEAHENDGRVLDDGDWFRCDMEVREFRAAASHFERVQ